MGFLSYFTTNEWKFHVENMFTLMEQMSAEDRQTFNFDVRSIDWPSYIETYTLGTRQYILKDNPSTLPTARRHLRR